jgi:cytochrome c553
VGGIVRVRIAIAVAVWAFLLPAASLAAGPCASKSEEPLVPTDRDRCAQLEKRVRGPKGQLREYEQNLAKYLRELCHRDTGAGWKPDKHIRDTGPYVATFRDGKWSAAHYGTHPAVLVWYSPDMFDWLKRNRQNEDAPAASEPVPDGAMMIKEMFVPPASACAEVTDWKHLKPTKGIALMIRDRQASYDGWFWGWFDWTKARSNFEDWKPDWPARAKNALPDMGFGQYCTNCHASAKEQTFASLRNIEGEHGKPLVFLSHDFFLEPVSDQHAAVATAGAAPPPVAKKGDDGFVATYGSAENTVGALPPRDELKLPSETYDNVWMPAGGPKPSSQFLTSDQCIGCHDARGTGLQYDMTEPGPGDKLINMSPYATWRSSPMGMSGRDPIFYAQLASETKTFHPDSSAKVQDACLGCHGIGGQRQFAIDRFAASKSCEPFLRDYVNAAPFPPHARGAHDPAYGALARDGVTCNACHQMALTEAERAKYAGAPQNACLAERQAYLTEELKGFARTFTGSFYMTSPAIIYGPFENPKPASMKNAIGIAPEHNAHLRSSEVCGSCHVVHLPVLQRDKVLGHVYEQTTYAEWAFSDYRTGKTPDGNLPGGRGARAQSCQSCHMPNRAADGTLLKSKIAGIQEYSIFPQAEHTLEAKEIDLERRTGFARHTLVGLNLFLAKMAQQFPDVLGIRGEDPMLTGMGIDPRHATEQAILDQAKNRTAEVRLNVDSAAGALSARVTVVNKTGHKFPSGVGFRRAFVELRVLDANGDTLWASGRTNKSGMIVDENDRPIGGELWWDQKCARLPNVKHQPHYETIDRQDQAQIYEELVAEPAEVAPACGSRAEPAGPLTTSFLSQCAKAKDNRILPHGFLPLSERTAIAAALGAGESLAIEAGPREVRGDPDYESGGADTLVYRVPLAGLRAKPAAVAATLYYQATPPYYLQDRFCTAKGTDAARLYFTTRHLDLEGTAAQDWKLKLADTVFVTVP